MILRTIALIKLLCGNELSGDAVNDSKGGILLPCNRTAATGLSMPCFVLDQDAVGNQGDD